MNPKSALASSHAVVLQNLMIDYVSYMVYYKDVDMLFLSADLIWGLEDGEKRAPAMTVAL